jgi:invasion protein IalB
MGPREGYLRRADGVTVYYPFALVELLDYRQVDDNEGGEVLLSFEDEDGCHVTIRLRAAVVAALKSRLENPPDSSS